MGAARCDPGRAEEGQVALETAKGSGLVTEGFRNLIAGTTNAKQLHRMKHGISLTLSRHNLVLQFGVARLVRDSRVRKSRVSLPVVQMLLFSNHGNDREESDILLCGQLLWFPSQKFGFK
jgi:hypothetical protein